MMTTMPTARDQLFLDLFTTALEGGIGYWSQCSAYHWSTGDTGDMIADSDYRGLYADIVETEETRWDARAQCWVDDGKFHRIDRGVIARGYALAARRTEVENEHHWQCGCGRPPLVITQDSVDEWDFDASDADAIVQLGLYGKVVYG